jgi:hypothetical protein
MSAKPIFREVIRPPLWLIAFIYFLLFSFVIAIWAAFDTAAGVNASLIALVLGLVAIKGATKTISVEDGELRIGRAHIPLRYCGDVEVISKKEFLRARTRDADPAAFFALTFWISKGIKVEITDERDPTPYWLISTKRAQALQAALKS